MWLVAYVAGCMTYSMFSHIPNGSLKEGLSKQSPLLGVNVAEKVPLRSYILHFRGSSF